MNVDEDYAILKSEFPYLRPLDVEFYKGSYNAHPIRLSKVMILLGSMLNCERFRNLDHRTQNSMVKKIETSCFNTTITKASEDGVPCTWENTLFHEMYSHTVYDKSVELNVSNNEWFIQQILDSKIAPTKVGDMTPEEMNPDANREIMNIINLRKAQVIVDKTSAMYECEKCLRRKAIITTVQTRSADEAKDIYVNCQFCGHVFMIRN
jgi:DNA-directed RNA polymerase subunit M/transcription elongation factor TFIIS